MKIATFTLITALGLSACTTQNGHDDSVAMTTLPSDVTPSDPNLPIPSNASPSAPSSPAAASPDAMLVTVLEVKESLDQSAPEYALKTDDLALIDEENILSEEERNQLIQFLAQ